MLEPTSIPTIAPERARYLRDALVAIATTVTAQMLSEVEGGSSTDSLSPADRFKAQAMVRLMPWLRGVLLSRLSDVDPVALERSAGAIATAIESVLAQAPGDPLPRYRIEFDADSRLVLLPLEAV